MTINEHISAIRGLIHAFSDETKYGDQFLYSLLTNARAELLRRRVEQWKPLNPANYQTFCMPLEQASPNECGTCVPNSGCTVLRSTYEMPNAIMGRNRIQVEVTYLNGDKIDYVPGLSSFRNRIYTRISKSRPAWTIQNNKLYIYTTEEKQNLLRFVTVKLLASDPTDLAEIKACGDTDTNDQYCYDILSDDFPMDGNLAQAAREMVLTQLQLSLQIPQDETNDSRSEV